MSSPLNKIVKSIVMIVFVVTFAFMAFHFYNEAQIPTAIDQNPESLQYNLALKNNEVTFTIEAKLTDSPTMNLEKGRLKIDVLGNEVTFLYNGSTVIAPFQSQDLSLTLWTFYDNEYWGEVIYSYKLDWNTTIWSVVIE